MRSCRGPAVSARPLPRRAIHPFGSALLPPFLFLFFFLFPKSSPFALSFLFRNGTERRRSRAPKPLVPCRRCPHLTRLLWTSPLVSYCHRHSALSSPTFSLAISLASMPPRTHRALPELTLASVHRSRRPRLACHRSLGRALIYGVSVPTLGVLPYLGGFSSPPLRRLKGSNWPRGGVNRRILKT